ncbi:MULTISPECIES: hypothetical protein [Pseudomonas]|nr:MULTISPECIES: hypothetical protein [Pseudomonas]
MAQCQKDTDKAAAEALLLARIQEAARQGAQLGYQMVLKDLHKGPSQ